MMFREPGPHWPEGEVFSRRQVRHSSSSSFNTTKPLQQSNVEFNKEVAPAHGLEANDTLPRSSPWPTTNEASNQSSNANLPDPTPPSTSNNNSKPPLEDVAAVTPLEVLSTTTISTAQIHSNLTTEQGNTSHRLNSTAKEWGTWKGLQEQNQKRRLLHHRHVHNDSNISSLLTETAWRPHHHLNQASKRKLQVAASLELETNSLHKYNLGNNSLQDHSQAPPEVFKEEMLLLPAPPPPLHFMEVSNKSGEGPKSVLRLPLLSSADFPQRNLTAAVFEEDSVLAKKPKVEAVPLNHSQKLSLEETPAYTDQDQVDPNPQLLGDLPAPGEVGEEQLKDPDELAKEQAQAASLFRLSEGQWTGLNRNQWALPGDPELDQSFTSKVIWDRQREDENTFPPPITEGTILFSQQELEAALPGDQQVTTTIMEEGSHRQSLLPLQRFQFRQG